jgi:hypothetical protein
MLKYFRSLNTLSNHFYENKHLSHLKNNTSFFENYIDPLFGKYKVFTINKGTSNSICLRIEETNYNKLQPVASIDIIKCYDENKLKINNYMIKSKYFCKDLNNIYGLPLDENDQTELKKIIFEFADNIAKNEGFNKIELDVHSNLNYYKNDNLQSYGFYITEKIAKDNLFWITTEKKIINEF